MEFPLHLLKFSGTSQLPLILQAEVAECGLACLGMVAGYHGHVIDLHNLRHRFTISSNGATLEQLIKVADQLNLSSRPLRLELEELNQLQTPAILHWDLNHFVVLKRINNKFIWIHDPAKGECKLTLNEASKHFTGIGLELIANSGFEKKVEQAIIPLSDFFSYVVGLKRVLIQVFLLSLLLQLFTLASPFFMQIVMDDIIITQDMDLLLVVAIGFLLLTLLSQAATTLRSLVLMHLGNQLSVQMTSNLFRHLLRLPLNYFETRHLGDIVSRFGSLGSIQSLLTTGMIAVVLDGLMAITTLIMMFIYLPQLAWVVIGVVLIYSSIRAIAFSTFRRLNEEQIMANAKKDSNFMETIRAVQSIKVFGKEVQRQTLWHNHYASAVNTGIRTSKLALVFEVANNLLFSIENILVIYLGAKAVIVSEISIGMLLAFISYKGQFTSKASALIGKAIEYKMLNMHLSRISDIALADKEPGLDDGQLEHPLSGQLVLKDVSFRYDDNQPYLFENVNFTFRMGESVAIIGPSGGGKTTLLKVMLGLLKTSGGKVMDRGVSIHSIGLRNYRNQVAAVMQDDQLLSGSMSDNISFFDPKVDQTWVEQCSKMAAIHSEIMLMPMGYNSLVGDMGTTLSGGQKQRILLARALYKQPKILFLDEATSHLDTKLESTVNQAIKQLNITRIIIAHRPETIRSADRVVQLINGTLCEV
jgi:ATP-binding cassette, subfamily B, bacterial CvaB/MchF/RaxB